MAVNTRNRQDINYLNYITRVVNDGGSFEQVPLVQYKEQYEKIMMYGPVLYLFPSSQKNNNLYTITPDNLTGFTCTRNSVGAFFNRNGILQNANINQPRITYNPINNEYLGLLIEPNSTNFIRNSSNIGAVVGTPGTLPNLWVRPDNSVLSFTRQIVSTGVEYGLPYIDIRLFGTAASTDSVEYEFDPRDLVLGVSGNTFTCSLYMKLVNVVGTIPQFSTAIRESTSGGTTVSNTLQSFTPTNILQRYSQTRVLNGQTTAFTSFTLRALVIGGTNYDFTIRIASPQFERNRIRTSYILTTGTTQNRIEDVVQSQLLNYSSTQWTVYFDIQYLDNIIMQSDTGDVSAIPFIWYFRRLGTTGVNFWNQANQQNLGSLSTSINNRYRAIISFNGSTINTFINGIKTGNQITPINPTPFQNFINTNTYRLRSSKVELIRFFDGSHVIRDMVLYDYQLNDEQSINLTTF